ncbi:MAG TPA: amino acid ABC transporter permease [Acidimicrobiales bacterium]|nr:amino acid ABC transporter permease [Acidimicrobiales bacterium]
MDPGADASAVAGDVGSGPPLPPGRFGSVRDAIREQGAAGALVAAASTVVVFGLIVWWVVSSENWPALRQQFFSWDDFRESWPAVLDGFWLNMKLFAIAQVLILVFSLLVAVIRSLRGAAFFPARLLAILYIDLFRGIPLYLAIVLLGFGIPRLRLDGVPSDQEFWAVVALVLSYSAYTAEVYRSGIDSVHESQRSAARALGLSQWQALRFAVLPQAVRNVIPALLNGLVSLQKDVALVGVLGIREAVKEAELYTSRTYNYTSYVAATVLFLAASIPIARFTDWYTARDRRRRLQTLA